MRDISKNVMETLFLHICVSADDTRGLVNSSLQVKIEIALCVAKTHVTWNLEEV